LKFLKLLITYTTEQYHLIFLSTKELTPEATTIFVSKSFTHIGYIHTYIHTNLYSPKILIIVFLRSPVGMVFATLTHQQNIITFSSTHWRRNFQQRKMANMRAVVSIKMVDNVNMLT